jgi:hypothetical protein
MDGWIYGLIYGQMSKCANEVITRFSLQTFHTSEINIEVNNRINNKQRDRRSPAVVVVIQRVYQ